MISKDELELLITGAVGQAGLGIESAHGRVLTRTEVERLSAVIATAMRLLADRCHSAKVTPPPAPTQRPPRQFAPMQTQEIRVVTDEDVKKTLAGMSAEDVRKATLK